MTDAAISYHEDVTSRSIQKKSASHRNNGSAVTKLGNKRMTNKEIVERHGPVETYDMNSFMSYDAFRSLPKDLQIEYVNILQDKYDIGLAQLAKNLFHVEDGVLTSHLRINGILGKCNATKKRGKTKLREFLEDIDEQRRRTEFANVVDIAEAREQEKETGIPSGFITYDEYQKFSPEDRLKYVNGLVTKWNVGNTVISVELFGKSTSTLWTYFKSKGLKYQLKKIIGASKDPLLTQCRNKAFVSAIEKWKAEGKEEVASAFSEETVSLDIPVVEPEKKAEELNQKRDIFYDAYSGHYFTATTDAVEEAINSANEKLKESRSSSISNLTNTFLSAMQTQSEEKPAEETIPQKAPESDIFHDSSFTASYTALGVDEKQFEALARLFEGKKVHVEIRITEIT